MSFTNVFGGSPVAPAQPQYEAITLSGSISLVWPLETAGGVPYVAAQIDVTPTTGGLSIAMPPANQGSTGIACVITNVGATGFTVTDNLGTQIQTIAPNVTYIITLTDNTTVAGTWRSYQLGATTSSAVASALAGAGLEAVGSQLRVRILTQKISANAALTPALRAYGVVWTGAGIGTLQLNSVGTLQTGWWCLVTNEGGGALTISTTGGDLINGQANITLPPGSAGNFYSTIIVCNSDGFYAYGVPDVIPIAGGGTGATTPNGALTNFGGTAVGISIFTAPNAAAVRSILGLSTSSLTENTITSNTSIGAGGGSIAYQCNATLTLNLAITTGLQKTFFFYVNAMLGPVTITPDPSDKIGRLSAGASYVMAQGTSLLMVTDANGNWYPFPGDLGGITGSPPWSIATGTGDAITATYTPANTNLIDGLSLAFRAPGANTLNQPTFQPDGLPSHHITKYGGQQLVAGDIRYEHTVKYSGTTNTWELLNPASTEPPWVDAGGTADAITGTYTPLNTRLYDGLLLGFRATAPNATTTPTYNADGLGAFVITKLGGNPLVPGDIAANNAEYLIRYYLAGTRWELLNPSQVSGSSYNSRLFTSNGTFTIPANASTLTVFKFTGVAGGGGSGSATAANGTATPGGGAGGGFIAAFSGFTGGQNVTIALGAAGIAGVVSGADGGNGGPTSLTYSSVQIASATGGFGSTHLTTAGPSSENGGLGGSGSVPGGAGLTVAYGLNFQGTDGSPSISHTTTALAYAGQGGASIFGPGGSSGGAGGVGGAGNAPLVKGAGAGGACRQGGADVAGAAGGGGQVLVEWWL